MSSYDFKMPKLGESITEAAIITWFKNVGDTIEVDEMLLEVATDKVDSEVPSTVSGVVEDILFKTNDKKKNEYQQFIIIMHTACLLKILF